MPHRIEIGLGLVLTVVLLVADLRVAIGFSSFGVLLYYFVANAAAYTQENGHRRYRKAWQLFGAAMCLVLVATLPWGSILAGVTVVVLGVVWRLLRRRRLR